MKFEKRIAAVEYAAIILIQLLILPKVIGPVADVIEEWDINVILAELIIVIPAIILLAVWYFIDMVKDDKNPDYKSITISERLMFAPVKVRTILWTIVLYILINPIVSLANAISMLFTENVMLESSTDILKLSFPLAFFLIVVYGPVCEEFVFRGLIYGGFRRYCKPVPAIVMSGLIFGLIHMNFNQFSYAFIIGIILALLNEASGSIITSIIIHMMVNGSSTIYMYLLNWIDSDLLKSAVEAADESGAMGAPVIAFLAIVSVISGFLAVLVLRRIAKLENREDPLLLITHSRQYKGGSVFTFTLVFVLLVNIGVIVLDMMS